MISRGKVTIVLLLFALTWFGLQRSSHVADVPIAKNLNSLPQKIGNYRLSVTFQSPTELLKLEGVEDYFQYNYIDKERNRINLYAGFYGVAGERGSFQFPKNCLPGGGGWEIVAAEKINLEVQLESGDQATVSQLLIRNNTDYRVVLFWYQGRGRIITSEYWERVYLIIDAVLQGRRDGAFVRIMTVAREAEIQQAKKRSRDFAGRVMKVLTEHLPGGEL